MTDPAYGVLCDDPKCQLCKRQAKILAWLLLRNDHELSEIVLGTLAADLARAGFNPKKD